MLVYKKRRFYKKTERKQKTPKQLERYLKGVANHRRIEILFLIADNKGISVEIIAEKLDCNIKTISEHTRRLAQAGLIRKEYSGRMVIHELSPYGKTFYSFIQIFSYS
ncbi:MAG: helix-turn-helix transcriptional regulator [Patescibacteria group bacterium]